MNSELKLYLPEPKRFRELSDYVGKKFSKVDLQEWASPMLQLMKDMQVVMYDHEGYMISCYFMRDLLGTTIPKKPLLQNFTAMMVGDKRNFSFVVEHMKEEEKKAYTMLLRSQYCKLEDIRMVLGMPERNEGYRYVYGIQTVKINLLFVEYVLAGYDARMNSLFYVSLQDEFREIMYDTLLPGERDMITTEELPEDLQEGCFERSTLMLMPVVEALMEQDVLKKGANKFTVPSVRKGCRQLGAEEFFTGLGVPKSMTDMRGSIMLQTMGNVYHLIVKGKKPATPEDMLKAMYYQLTYHVSDLYPILFDHLSGLGPSYYSDLMGNDILKTLHKAFPEMRVGEWIEFNSIIRRYFLSTAQCAKLELLRPYIFRRPNVSNKFHDEVRQVSLDQAPKELGLPFIKGLFFCMAAWGWFDIGCREYDDDDISPYDSLEMVRLTPLGAYVLGVTEKYEVPLASDEKVYFELDPQRLIIRSLSDSNPYEGLLADTCIPIGNRRYKMNAETFLARCTDKSDVEGKIEFFKRYISGDLTPVWTDFFGSLLKRCNPLTSVSQDEYVVYRISPDNKPLIHLLANDPVLRSLVIRAEQFLILVETANKSKFDRRLKSLGYLL